MPIPNPYDNPAAWRQILVAGQPLPGLLVSLTVPDREYEWAVQMGLGFGGAATVFRASKLIEAATAVLMLPDAEAFAAAETALRTLVGNSWPQNVKVKPKAYAIEHPMFQWVGMAKAALKTFSPPKDATGKLNWQIGITFIEYSPTKPVVTGPAEPAKLNGPPKPKDALEGALNDALTAFSSPGEGLFSGLLGGG